MTMDDDESAQLYLINMRTKWAVSNKCIKLTIWYNQYINIYNSEKRAQFASNNVWEYVHTKHVSESRGCDTICA